MSRYSKGLFHVAQHALQYNGVGIKVRNQTEIINKYCSSATMPSIHNETHYNLNNNTNINQMPVCINNITDENLEWCDIPADKLKMPKALDICDEDVSHIAQYMRPSFNFAKYANESPTIQELVKLGVELYKLESKPKAMQCLLSRNFDDMKPYIQFLHDCGVPPESIGRSITKNPLIFEKDMDDLHTRIRYLRAHNFKPNDIAQIITSNPVWLNYSTLKIDERLAFFQREFKLTGNETRILAVTSPTLITYKHMNVVENTFALREEMGFEANEIKLILFRRPKVWMRGRNLIVEVFDYAHNIMNLPHGIIARMPKILTTRIEIIKNRHEFLKLLNRVQYDPSKPLYISPNNISYGDDYEFCTNVAKTSIELYNMFLKTR